MDSSMCASLILPMLKEDPRYTPSYRKAWIAKQKALEKMHSGWDLHIMNCGSGVRCWRDTSQVV
ncbi:hypothetical protein J1N35_031847 [Gossypium stocksii]|uniref:Uncharacterized protein n=1 Tax=Gossypium stocksii TaxID=47602 RepID=A0A9D3V2Q3_9ROSI|nr:hypothetical protein J1N35_031847 [Gossypium stocksii]